MKMQRLLVLVMFATILAGVLAACGGAAAGNASQPDLAETLIAKEQEKWSLFAQGKMDDLLAASEGPNFGKPEWAKSLRLLDTGPNSTVSDSMEVSGGPVYILCASCNQDRYRIGYLGPIEVSQ